MTDRTHELHNDEPVLNDALARAQLAEEIADAVATGEPPLVFGVSGDWGSGKTSLLHQIAYVLSGECQPQIGCIEKLADTGKKPCGFENSANNYKDKVRVVWFEAWRYQNEPVPVVALLHEIRSQLGRFVKCWNTIGKATEVALRSAFGMLENLTAKINILGFEIGGKGPAIQAQGEKWEKEHFAEKLPANTIRLLMEEAINQILLHLVKTNKPDRLVILIDDLDRCNPEAAYKLLEGLKLFLTLSNCVFVLGMNKAIVEDAIGKQIPGDSDSGATAKERASAYLDKICQNVWWIPSVKDPKAYLLDLLRKRVGIDDPVDEKDLLDLIDKALGDGSSLPSNPRRIKGLANAIIRSIGLLPVKTNEWANPAFQLHEARRMLIVCLIHQFNDDLFRLWEMHPALFDRIREWSMEPIKRPPQPEDKPTTDKRNTRSEWIEAIFDRLRPVVIPIAEGSSSSEYIRKATFADPADPRVLWAQPLIVDEEIDCRKEGDNLLSDDLKNYLRRAGKDGESL